MAFIAPKTDWLLTDSINAADFNRIESNIVEIYFLLANNNFKPPSITSMTSRTTASFDYLSDINRIENNLNQLNSNFKANPPGWQPTKIWAANMGFTNDDANRLEASTQQLYDLANLAVQNLRYCGTQTCGSTWGLIS